MTGRGLLGRLAAGLAATAVACAGLVGLTPATPAYAAACSASTGVTVVVDFHQLGGGVRSECVAGGGGDKAVDLFPAAGFPLRDLPRQPGFVCQVSGVPSDGRCNETDRYWSLWSSSGNSGSGWTYATQGASTLTVPDGGLVAFSWNASSDRVQPGASAQRPAPAPSTGGGSGGNGGGGGNGNGGASGGGGGGGNGGSSTPAAPSSSPDAGAGTSGSGAGSAGSGSSGSGSGGGSGGDGRGDRGSGRSGSARGGEDTTVAPGQKNDRRGKGKGRDAEAGVTPSDQPSDSAAPSDAPTEAIGSGEQVAAQSGDDGLPVWVAPGLVVVLLGGAGIALALRRRAAGDRP